MGEEAGNTGSCCSMGKKFLSHKMKNSRDLLKNSVNNTVSYTWKFGKKVNLMVCVYVCMCIL
jgi:hypothetical protein